jgi:hypothetical protein
MTTSDDDQRTAPPYDGRRESADVDTDGGVAEKDGAKVGGATGPVEGAAPAKNAGQDRKDGVSPADEQPAEETSEGTSPAETDEGVGPAHTPGVPRGEDSGA